MSTLRSAAYIAPLAAVTGALVLLLARDGRSGTFLIALAPFVLLATARWVERETDLAPRVLRSVAAHVFAVMTAVVLMALARSSDPGASAHGGVFLMLAILSPIGVVLGQTLGVVASLLAFGVRSS